MNFTWETQEEFYRLVRAHLDMPQWSKAQTIGEQWMSGHIPFPPEVGDPVGPEHVAWDVWMRLVEYLHAARHYQLNPTLESRMTKKKRKDPPPSDAAPAPLSCLPFQSPTDGTMAAEEAMDLDS